MESFSKQIESNFNGVQKQIWCVLCELIKTVHIDKAAWTKFFMKLYVHKRGGFNCNGFTGITTNEAVKIGEDEVQQILKKLNMEDNISPNRKLP